MINEVFALKNYAHLGDAVWEVFVREYIITKTSNSKKLHKYTTDKVNAHFQKEMLDIIHEKLTDEELDIVRRARNLTIPIGRKAIQHDYRLATAFEVLIGFWYLHDKERLNFFWNRFKNLDKFLNI